jgi:aspartyl-tRNA(Asn)/glutamyl-tRNA(Gln) amidotransferase subunit B
MTEKLAILAQYPDYAINIGIEVHVQLQTKSKIFCSCPNSVDQIQNSQICQICAGYPGVLPVLNHQVIDYAIAIGLATESQIAPISKFARKHYFYPDLPKNYQITQDKEPICELGKVKIQTPEGPKEIRLIRIHIEEDAGKNIHAPSQNISLVNLNRTGTPLLEIVSYPDITSSFEAKQYLKTLRDIVHALGICSGNMEDGAFRADTNISVRKKTSTEMGTRCELKNINSFKFIGDAVEYEIERQIKLLEKGGVVRQETRLWDTKSHKTVIMRSKEEAADYRYFLDPDLPWIEVTPAMIADVKAQLPELPEAKFQRYLTVLGLTPYEAEVLMDEPEVALYFEAARKFTNSRQLVNWILRDLLGYLKEQKIALSDCKFTPKHMAELVDLLDQAIINNHAAKTIFEQAAKTGESPTVLVETLGLKTIGSEAELEQIAQELIAQNPDIATEYRAGKTKLIGFFVGQMMQKTQGRGNPQIIQKILLKLLS